MFSQISTSSVFIPTSWQGASAAHTSRSLSTVLLDHRTQVTSGSFCLPRIWNWCTKAIIGSLLGTFKARAGGAISHLSSNGAEKGGSKEGEERSICPEACGGERLREAEMAAAWPRDPVLDPLRALGATLSAHGFCSYHSIFPTTLHF